MTENTTHLERLVAWMDGGRINIDPKELHRLWAAPLLPTRRFGPDGWVTFHMAAAPAQATVGDLVAWLLFDARRLRLIAYLERPLADTFGIVTPFMTPLKPLSPDLLPMLGAVGEAFFTGDEPPNAAEPVRSELERFDDGFRLALVQAAPDFLGWLDL